MDVDGTAITAVGMPSGMGSHVSSIVNMWRFPLWWTERKALNCLSISAPVGIWPAYHTFAQPAGVFSPVGHVTEERSVPASPMSHFGDGAFLHLPPSRTPCPNSPHLMQA